MTNHELLNIIGEVSEDYVLEAADNAARPRFRWQTLAACAACAALIVAAYPAYRALRHKGSLPQNAMASLHAYTVVEGGGVLDTADATAATGGSEKAPVPDPNVPGGAYVGGGGNPLEQDEGEDGQEGPYDDAPSQDAPAQETAIAQYQGLLRGLGGQGGDLPREPETYPDWFAGSWIDNSYYPEAKLAVAIVDGLRTPELESQIEGWCGGEVLFRDAQYSLEHLKGLMDPAVKSLDGTGLFCGIGVDEEENCLGMDIYSPSGDPIPDQVLMELARLDPSGDAIRVRVFTGTLSLADDVGKGPAPDEPAADPVFNGAWAEPVEPTEFSVPDEKRAEPSLEAETAPVRGGAQSAEELPETTETEQPAHYGLLPHDE